MAVCDIYPNLSALQSDQQQFKLNRINKIKDYFVAEIRERELMSKRIGKYIASFDYFDESLIFLSVITGSIPIASFATVIAAPAEIISASFSLAISISAGIIKKLLKTTRSKKKKHNKIAMLAKSKLNTIESNISEALINNEISREPFMTIIYEEKNIEKQKKALEWWIIKELMLIKITWMKKAKKIGVNEVAKRNEIINNSLKP